MMKINQISKSQLRRIDALVDHFECHRADLERFLKVLREFLAGSKELMECIHSIKWRVKAPTHLRDKLTRKAVEAKQKKVPFNISKESLFEEINDLVGIRILHLHTGQFPEIHRCLLQALDEGLYPLFEKPFVRSWDDETKEFFRECGIIVEDSPTMYTSVHYVVEANQRTRFTCEIQLRTLMEEVWGEVNHSINYPHSTGSIACKEQIKALARLSSGCTRLVDSIFRSHDEYQGRGS